MPVPTPKSAVVTGASSGVGRAVAIKLAHAGWRVAATARREHLLRETAALAGPAASAITPIPCDILHPDQIKQMAQRALSELGDISLLVNSAGTNTPARTLRDLPFETYQRVLEINLTGAYLCAQAFLPTMRKNCSGTIVNIISEAGRRASEKAGVAYVISKFGLAGLTQSINAEERANGIRAIAIFPGDIDTPLLENRPVIPSADQRARMLQPEDVADCVMLAVNLPPRAIIEELIIRPR